MASANIEMVKKEIVTIVEEPFIKLTLTEDEAQALRELLGWGTSYLERKPELFAIFNCLKNYTESPTVFPKWFNGNCLMRENK